MSIQELSVVILYMSKFKRVMILVDKKVIE